MKWLLLPVSTQDLDLNLPEPVENCNFLMVPGVILTGLLRLCVCWFPCGGMRSGVSYSTVF